MNKALKKIITSICSFALILPLGLGLTACAHEHDFETNYSINATHHWQVCKEENCDVVQNYGEHIDANEDDMCDVCKYGANIVIGNTNYSSLQEAVTNAEAGATIVLNNDLDLPTAVEVNKELTIDLNGKTLTITEDTAGDGVFMVVDGGKLTINGDGVLDGCGNNIYNIVIFANGGEVIINGGTYTNENLVVDPSDGDSNHYDVIYAKNGGKVTINGGVFKGKTPKWTLNEYDGSVETTDFIVKGGSFKGYNPSNNSNESTSQNYVADGYEVVQDGDYYKVVPVQE